LGDGSTLRFDPKNSLIALSVGGRIGSAQSAGQNGTMAGQNAGRIRQNMADQFSYFALSGLSGWPQPFLQLLIFIIRRRSISQEMKQHHKALKKNSTIEFFML
jgi:hypothetical protein